MADITITVNSVNPKEARAAQFALDRENSRRAERELPSHPSVTAFLEDRIVNWLLPSWIRDEQESNAQDTKVFARWQMASNAERAAALAALPPLPTGV